MNKHFIVPEGDVLISFSGGRTSGFMLHQILEANNGLPDKAKVVFANTGREMPETLDFVQECSERWSVPITWLEYTRKNNRVNFNVVNHNSASRNGEPFKRLIYKPYLPNIARRFCTEQLKDNRWFNWYPLNDAKLSKLNVMNFWNKQSFDLKIMRGAGNCDGCFLKSEATLAAMFRLHPDRMQWWVEMENQVNASFHKSRTYSGLQSFVQQQQDWIFDDENFLCQADDGECTD